MRADRAFSGGLLPRKHMPAIQTHPTGFHIADKKLIFPKESGKPLKSLRVNFFDLRDLLEMAGYLRKSFLLGFSAKAG